MSKRAPGLQNTSSADSARRNHNFYEMIPKKLIDRSYNPAYEKHLMKVPFRALIVGGSGSGKTNTLMELIRRTSGTFEQIAVCLRDKNEPLYRYLEMKCPEGVSFYEGVENIPPISEFKGCGQTLIVFDDLVIDKDQSRIGEFFIRGRKVGKGISCVYLSQSFYRCPKLIRINCNYILLKKLSSTRDLNMILAECSLGVDKKQLTGMYKYSTADFLGFLMLDLEAPDGGRFRSGFLELLDPAEF